MKRLQFLLCAIGLAALPIASAHADQKPQVFERHYSFSTAKGRLGAIVMSLTPELRAYFGVAKDRGVLVASVQPDSAAAKVGLRAGDVIVDVQGTPVDRAGDVVAAIAKVKKGDKANVAIVRDKVPLLLQPTLTEDPAPPMPAMRSLQRDFDDFFRQFDDDQGGPGGGFVPNPPDDKKT